MLPCKLAMIKQKNYAFKLGKPNGFIYNPCGSLAKYPVIPIRSEESVKLRGISALKGHKTIAWGIALRNDYSTTKSPERA